MRKLIAMLLVLCSVLSLSAVAFAEGKTPAYSVEGYVTVDENGNRVVTGRDDTSSKAMAVASKYEVSQVGAEIMAKGGNAVDAAVAMGFALGVCEPFTSGLGGGGLATIHTADGQNFFIDFREIAPAAATLDLYLTEDGKNNGGTRSGGLASGIPGECAGLLYMLDNYGTMTRQEVMAPAIRIATEGFTVSEYCANAISSLNLYSDELMSIYLDEDGLPYEVGDVITNPYLAATLQTIADNGVEAFYTGEIAQAVIDSLTAQGGVMTMEDLAGYKPTAIDPVIGDYRGYTIISSPPPSSGGTHLIEILNILENFDVGSLEVNGPEYCHLWAETLKMAFADRAKYMADTAFTNVPLGGLTSQDYADMRAQEISLETAMEQAAPADPLAYEHTDTTHFSIADAAGNCVGITKTINYYWGSGVYVEGCGFMMNNQMDDFSTDPESVNKIEPGKKPLSSMSPTVVLKPDGTPFLVVGTPGGSRIFTGVAEVISRCIDHGMDVQTAVCVPKIWNSSNRNSFQYENALVGYEAYAITEETAAKLTEMGHGEIKTASSGAMQTIMFLEDGTLVGMGDPRQDGKAVGVK